MRVLVAMLAMLLLWPPAAAAEWQIKPFFALTFGGGTTFADPEQAVGGLNAAIGASGAFLGNVLGVEGDFGYGPGFFEAGDRFLVQDSAVTTVTGNVVLALPQRLAAYSLRPYFVAGGGLMRVRRDGVLGALPVSATLPTTDVGGGVTGFFSDHVGVSWDMRYFRSLSGEREATLSGPLGEEQLSFWRLSMALALRY
jgi:hypothetical protein